MDQPDFPPHGTMLPRKPNGSFAGLLLALLAGGYLLAGCGLSTRALFPARKLDPSVKLDADPASREISVRTSDGVDLSALHFDNGGQFLFVYFHGNAGALDSWQGVNQRLKHFGGNVLMVDYRGYGKSGGRITEDGLYLDARATLEKAHELGYADSQIVVYGFSIGSGIAVDVAQGRRFKALILEAPYASIRSMVYREYWYLLPYLYFPYRLNSCAKADKIRTPTLILHGTADRVIPYRYGQELSQCFDSSVARMVAIDGGKHSDLFRFPGYRTAVADFLGTLR